MADLVQHPVLQAISWALVHFIWQGAAIALAAMIAFRVVRASASLRYAIGVGALAAMLAAPMATFVSLLDAPAMPARAQADAAAAAEASNLAGLSESTAAELGAAPTTPVIRISPDVLGVAVAAWLAGVLFFSVRLIGGWIVARRMVSRSVQPAAARIQGLAADVAQRLELRRAVRILESSAIAVPVMVGWLKPTIVLPIAALSGLTPTQVEALLAHELAHVRRHDYLVNLLQSVAEAVLFYHPAVWWLSRRVRADRELCCDDLAVGVCDPLVYATALTNLAAMTTPRVALAATDGDLLSRVRRILGHSEAHVTIRGNIMSGLALGLVAAIAIPVALISATQAPAHPQTHPATAAARHTPDVIHLAGRASVHVEPGHPVTLSADHMAMEQATPQQADQRRVEELRRMLDQVQRQLAEMELKRAEELRIKLTDGQKKELVVEPHLGALAHAQAARNAEIAVASREQHDVAAARQRHENARALFEKGLVSSSQMREAEQALAVAQNQNNAHASLVLELQAAREKLARSRTLVEKGLLSSRDLEQMELQVADLDRRQLMSKVKEHATELQSERRKMINEDLAAQNALRDRVNRERMSDEFDSGDASQPVRAGDTLGITIEGEPDLPAIYTVKADGTIRLPFVGTIKVAGLTTAQVRAAVGKVLADRKLGSSSQVSVTLRRSIRVR